jgi:hypothetical protein
MGQQVAHVEQIARMLAIERGNELASIEVREGYDRHLRKAECIFYEGYVPLLF